jgi:arylsulfatase A-like enzyme
VLFLDVSAVDEAVGNLSKASTRLNMAAKTLWVVISDNGGPSDDQCGDSWASHTLTGRMGVDRNVASNFPMRGKKNTVWE